MLNKKEILKLKFDKDGLIPAIVVDAENKNVLMLAYMNKESLNISIEKKLTCFWSRSRGELWTKGETSGNYQHIKNISADCDWDTLKIEVIKDGPACHTGNESCFFNNILENEELKQKGEFTFNKLLSLIKDRKKTLPKDSYTTYLFQKGIDKILKKVGEESTEVIIAAKADDKAETIYEISDLAYHILVLMAQMNIEVDEIRNELARRQIINHKVKQEKMT